MTRETISIRKPALDFERPIERFYFGGDPVKTYIFNALNLLFPDGERYFVKAVTDHIKFIEDPELLREVRAFTGQEGQHAKQHERFFAVMKQQDYRFGRFLKAYNRGVRWGSKHFSPGLRLSITAGSEHYTATMASAVLALSLLDGCDPTMRALITWHALEEIEHKHVAYDVFAKLYPNSYPLRVFGFALATASIFGHAAYAYGFLAEQDVRKGRVTRAQLRQSAKNLLESDQRKFFLRLLRAMVQYYKPGFHPNQNDDRGLIARFEAEVPLTAAVHDAAE